MRHLEKKPRSRPRCRLDSRRPLRHSGPVSEKDLKRLGQAVKDRRGELGLSQEEFCERTSIDGQRALSIKQLSRIETGHVGSPRTKTLGALDRACGWTPGSARNVLEHEDGKPTVLERAQPASSDDINEEMLAHLIEQARFVRSIPHVPDTEVRAFIQQVAEAWVSVEKDQGRRARTIDALLSELAKLTDRESPTIDSERRTANGAS